jgi:sulfide:quinone oxidoreductase
MAARELWSQGGEDVELTFVSPEDSPLAIFGSHASEAVANLLAETGIKFEGSSYAEVEHDAILIAPNSRRLEVDRVVTLPRLEGYNLAGLPANSFGFIPTDEFGKVRGVKDVFAAGDGTAFPIKQGGLATQQADSVASVIANMVDGQTVPQRFEPILRGVLLTGGMERFLRQHPAGGGGDGEFQTTPLWWPPTKIVGRYITSYLYDRDESAILAAAPPADGDHIVVERRVDEV